MQGVAGRARVAGAAATRGASSRSGRAAARKPAAAACPGPRRHAWAAALVASILLLAGEPAAAARGAPAPRVSGDIAAYEAAAATASASGPTGTIVIGNGANVTCGSTWRIPITVTAANASSTPSACLRIESSSSGGFGSCVSVTGICALLLTNGTATFPFKPCVRWQSTIKAQVIFKSSSGATGAPVTTSAIIDCVSPSMAFTSIKVAGSTAAAGNASVSLYWTGRGARDSGSGVAGYKLAYRAATDGGSPPKGCGAGTGVTVVPAYWGATAANPMVVSGLPPGVKVRFRLCAYDYAGNYASGITRATTTAV